MGISHPTPKLCNLKVSTQQPWAVLPLLQVAVRRLKRKALRASFMRTMQYLQSSPTAHYVHSLHFCRDVHLERQTSSEVDILVLQSQVSSGMAEQRKQVQWTVDYEAE